MIDYATRTKGYKYVATEAELNAVTSLAPGQRLLGLFHDTNMTTEFNPLIASDTGRGLDDRRKLHAVPTARHRADAGGDDRRRRSSCSQGNPKGFVLQVEGASIDKRDHAADACGQIGELLGMRRRRSASPRSSSARTRTRWSWSPPITPTRSQIIPVSQVPRRRLHDAADRRRRADPHRLRHRPGQPARQVPHRARPSRSSPPARAPPTSTARSTRPSCSRSSPTPRPATARRPPPRSAATSAAPSRPRSR